MPIITLAEVKQLLQVPAATTLTTGWTSPSVFPIIDTGVALAGEAYALPAGLFTDPDAYTVIGTARVGGVDCGFTFEKAAGSVTIVPGADQAELNLAVIGSNTDTDLTLDAVTDALYTALIPMAQARIVQYTRNHFLATIVTLRNNTISFTNASPPVISDSAEGFLTALFASNTDIFVRGSKLNDGHYHVATAAAGSLTLATTDALETEVAEEYVRITRVRWPIDIKPATAELIKFYATRDGKLVNQESLPGGYSATFKGEAEVMAMFNRWRKPYE